MRSGFQQSPLPIITYETLPQKPLNFFLQVLPNLSQINKCHVLGPDRLFFTESVNSHTRVLYILPDSGARALWPLILFFLRYYFQNPFLQTQGLSF